MYVQPSDRSVRQVPLDDTRGNVIVPKNYSGNAFRQYGGAEERTQAPPPPAPEALPDPPPDAVTTADTVEEEAAPVWKSIDRDDERSGRTPTHRRENEQERHGFFSRFPFLSSLLPPPRGKHKKDGLLPEWVVIAAVILLFFSEDGENDILPFLLLLLLWD